MAQDHLIFHTNDRVVTSTSLGNQEKWFDAEKNLWYKVDNGHFEALAEAMASEVLRSFTNAADLPGISIAHYWVDTADVHGLPQVLSVSENFKAGNESLITANTILRNSLGRGYIQEFNDRNSLKERIVFLVDSVEAATGFSGFGAYFTTLLELDALFLNQDRHLNNIALLHTDFGCKPCPIFDCGASFLLDFNLYRPDIETRAFLSKAQCLPFKSSFTRTVHTAQSLYGKQLEVDFARSDIEPLLDAYLDYYPKQFRYLLKERVLTVLLAQKKKLF